MVSRELVIILASCVGGACVIMVAMAASGGGAPPGTYVGNSNGAHMVTDPHNCYSFQTGCLNNSTYASNSDLSSGAYLSGDYKQQP
ncbi:MAG: hypothetical protein WA833_03640 [Nitrosotalea sp.]